MTKLERVLVDWLEIREYSSLEQLEASVSRDAADDPEACERAQYMRTPPSRTE